jgi:cation transport ATPase
MSEYNIAVEKQIKKIEKEIRRSLNRGEFSYFYYGFASKETEEYFKTRGVKIKKASDNSFAEFFITKNTILDVQEKIVEKTKEKDEKENLEKSILKTENSISNLKDCKKQTIKNIIYSVSILLLSFISIPTCYFYCNVFLMFSIILSLTMSTVLLPVVYYVYYPRYKNSLKKLDKNELKLNELMVQQYDMIIENHNQEKVRVQTVDETILEELREEYGNVQRAAV